MNDDLVRRIQERIIDLQDRDVAATLAGGTPTYGGIISLLREAVEDLEGVSEQEPECDDDCDECGLNPAKICMTCYETAKDDGA